MPDPSYGGKLTYVNNNTWRLEVLVDFNESSMPDYIATLTNVRYRLHKALAGEERDFESPDGAMIFASSTDTFSEDTYLLIVEGYTGWTGAAVIKQYFVQAGLQQTKQVVNTLGPFTLRFVGAPGTTMQASSLRLRHRNDSTAETERPVVAVPGVNAVEVTDLTDLGYFGLIQI